MDIRYRLWRQLNGRESDSGVETRVPVANAQHFLHAIVILKLEHRRANNVVETRANTTAGDNGCFSFTRFEEQPFPGPGFLEVNVVGQIITCTGLDLIPYARLVWHKGAALFATAPRELQRRFDPPGSQTLNYRFSGVIFIRAVIEVEIYAQRQL